MQKCSFRIIDERKKQTQNLANISVFFSVLLNGETCLGRGITNSCRCSVFYCWPKMLFHCLFVSQSMKRMSSTRHKIVHFILDSQNEKENEHKTWFTWVFLFFRLSTYTKRKKIDRVAANTHCKCKTWIVMLCSLCFFYVRSFDRNVNWVQITRNENVRRIYLRRMRAYFAFVCIALHVWLLFFLRDLNWILSGIKVCAWYCAPKERHTTR